MAKRIVSEAAWNAELEAKHEKLVEWLRDAETGWRADPAQ